MNYVVRAEPAGFGIDFGTTNSVVAVAYGEDKLEPLRDIHGNPHPSVVWYSPEGTVVGADAKRNINGRAEHQGNKFVRSIKVELGQGRQIDVGGRMRPAFEVAADIFRHLRADALQLHGWQVNEAVVTVPVHFDGVRRADIRRAAELAGIKVLRFVHEPFAAVVGYYRSRGMDLGALPEETLIVFDWGGGTLDMTLVRSSNGILEELATGGLPAVAGDRFDRYVEDFARGSLLERSGLAAESYLPTNATRDRIAEAAEMAKIELSNGTETTVRVANVIERDDKVYDLGERLSRSRFEEDIRKDVDAAMQQLSQMLEETRLSPSEINKVLLVGGTSEIPLVAGALSELFGVRAQPVANSQTVIAEGAAVVARAGYEPILTGPIFLELSDRSLHSVFRHGDRVPDELGHELTLFCTDNRDGVARLVVRQGLGSRDGKATKTHEVLPVPVERQLPPPYQHERVYARLAIDEDLILHVEGRGGIKDERRQLLIHDLRFGLRLR